MGHHGDSSVPVVDIHGVFGVVGDSQWADISVIWSNGCDLKTRKYGRRNSYYAIFTRAV